MTQQNFPFFIIEHLKLTSNFLHNVEKQDINLLIILHILKLHSALYFVLNVDSHKFFSVISKMKYFSIYYHSITHSKKTSVSRQKKTSDTYRLIPGK